MAAVERQRLDLDYAVLRRNVHPQPIASIDIHHGSTLRVTTGIVAIHPISRLQLDGRAGVDVKGRITDVALWN